MKHSEWLPWPAEVGIPKRTAQRYMALAEFGLESDTVTLLGGLAATSRFISLRKIALAALAAAFEHARQDNDTAVRAPIETACSLMNEMAVMLGADDDLAGMRAAFDRGLKQEQHQ